MDITTHEVLSMHPLRLKELLPPTGGAWGSNCVDNAFTKWCRQFIGAEYFDRVRHTTAFYVLTTQWEMGKTEFGGGDQDRVRLNMVDISRQLDIDATAMEVSTQHFSVQCLTAFSRGSLG